MSDHGTTEFLVRLRRQVLEARNQHARSVEAEESRTDRARELREKIQMRMQLAAEASDGAMSFARGARVLRPNGTKDFDFCTLSWLDPPPQRYLWAGIRGSPARVTLALIMGRETCQRTDFDPLAFDLSVLDRFILELADQGRWAVASRPSSGSDETLELIL
jgi:hypothetical protein